MLQDTLDDWDMFWSSSADITELVDVAVSFVSMLIEKHTLSL